MPTSNFRGHGLNKTVSGQTIAALKKNYQAAKSRRQKTGLFLGVDFLEELVQDLKAGGFDGLQLCYGRRNKQPGAEFPTMELVGTLIQLAGGDSLDIVKRGQTYASVESDSPSPSGLQCPPLRCE